MQMMLGMDFVFIVPNRKNNCYREKGRLLKKWSFFVK